MKAIYRNNGMTLLELLTVIAIIGMMAAVTLPAFHFMARGSRLNSAAKIITDTLNYARGMAITHRYAYYVEFDDEIAENPEKNRIGVFYLDRSINNPDPGNESDRRYVGDWEYLPEPVVFMDRDVDVSTDLHYRMPPDYLRFKANGGAYPSCTITIIDSSTYEDDPPFSSISLLKKAKTCNVTVLNTTGRVKAVFE